MLEALLRAIEQRSLCVTVVGQDNVGLSVACGAATAGMHVVGLDLDASRIASLRSGDNVVPGVADATFALALETGRLHFGLDADVVADSHVVLICVPTPVVDHRPDLSAVEGAARSVAPHLRSGALVILESTTYPGTTEQVVRPLLEEHGLRAGRDFMLAYSPERIDPGNVKSGLANTPRVVGGTDSASGAAATAFYAQLMDDVVPVSNCRAAELAMLCAEQGIDTCKVTRAAASKPFGYMPFYPGPGVGGHCIPLDPTYLAWQSRRDTGSPFRLVEMAQDVDAQMPSCVARRVTDALDDIGRSVRGARVLALAATYEPDVGDIRADRTPLTHEEVEAADCVLLLTPHSAYEPDELADRAGLLFDARNAVSTVRPNVVRL